MFAFVGNTFNHPQPAAALQEKKLSEQLSRIRIRTKACHHHMEAHKKGTGANSEDVLPALTEEGGARNRWRLVVPCR